MPEIDFIEVAALRRRTQLFLLALVLFLCPAIASAVTPQITVSASAVTLLGGNQTISITLTLIDSGNSGMMKIANTNIIPPGTVSSTTPGATATVGPCWGNDVIVDAYGNSNRTYYRVQVFTVSNGIVASTPVLQNFYQFAGSGTVDLSTATPLAPSFFTGPSGNVTVPGSLTVTGATILTPSAGNTINLLNTSPVVGQITGTGSAAPLAVYSIPANAVATLKGIRVTLCPNHGGGTASVTYVLSLNGQTVWSVASASTGNLSTTTTIVSTSTVGASFSTVGNGLTPAAGGLITSGLNWTANQNLQLTFNVASTDSVGLTQWIVEMLQ